MDELRRRKVEEQLRDEIAALIISGEVKDPRVGPFVSITRVEVARDASHARVHVSIIGDDASLEAASAGLNRAAGFIQGAVGKRLRIRSTPKLVFESDRGIREGFEMTEKLKGLLP
jgi:ribosome-binding factor A